MFEDVTHSWAQLPARLTCVASVEVSEPPLQVAVGQGMFLTHPVCNIYPGLAQSGTPSVPWASGTLLWFLELSCQSSAAVWFDAQLSKSSPSPSLLAQTFPQPHHPPGSSPQSHLSPSAQTPTLISLTHALPAPACLGWGCSHTSTAQIHLNRFYLVQPSKIPPASH